MKYIVFLCVSLMASVLHAEAPMPEIAEKYITQFKEIAISEMHRTGIPASIKLAQGLLESNWGRSSLATKANNHFGIKCGNSWVGESYFKKDDDYVNGKLVSSCFRKYDSALESFIDHSDFLSKPRYQKLYKHESTDYKSWAKGLKKAGYASDPKYPSKLIEIIEKYELYVFDQAIIQNEDKLIADIQMEESQFDDEFEEEEIFSNQAMGAVEITASPIDQKNTVDANSEVHIVREDELMEDIASKYDIALFRLYARNRMPKGSQPIVGEVIHLKNKIRLKDRPKFVRFPSKSDRTSEFLFETDVP